MGELFLTGENMGTLLGKPKQINLEAIPVQSYDGTPIYFNADESYFYVNLSGEVIQKPSRKALIQELNKKQSKFTKLEILEKFLYESKKSDKIISIANNDYNEDAKVYMRYYVEISSIKVEDDRINIYYQGQKKIEKRQIYIYTVNRKSRFSGSINELYIFKNKKEFNYMNSLRKKEYEIDKLIQSQKGKDMDLVDAFDEYSLKLTEKDLDKKKAAL